MRRTVRLRLTLLYGGLFLATGVLLIGLIYLLVAHAPFPGLPAPAAPPGLAELSMPAIEPPMRGQLEQQRAADLYRLLLSSGIALVVLTVLSGVLGWRVAGRVLAPVAAMTATVRQITAERLDRRLAATGPEDELKELADTFDDLLDRVQRAFAAQRAFVANASHELRTPLTLQRTLAEVALADPGADVRATLERLVVVGQDQDRLIAALLTLAESQVGLPAHSPVDLAEITRAALDQLVPGDLTVTAVLAPAPLHGDAELLRRMVGNLLDNAVRHNVAGGWIDVRTAGHSVQVGNSGPVVPADALDRLRQPFQRLRTGRTHRDGFGLGLSIVSAVVDAHGGRLELTARSEGGLETVVELPAQVPQ